jgi:hypothetical protein
MTTESWITCAEAAEMFGEPEEFVKGLADRAIIRVRRIGDETLVDQDYLLKWLKHRDAPRVRITEIYSGLRHVMLEHYRTIYARAQAQHPGARGALYEQLLREFLRDYLPQRFYVGSGQVFSSHTASDVNGLPYKLSRQIDAVIFDILNHPILLPKYELFPIEGTLAVIEVKSKLEKKTLIGTPKKPGALPNLESAKRLVSGEVETVWSEPKQVEVEGKMENLREMPSPLGAIFAFESIDPKTLTEHWKEWNESRVLRYRTDIICLLEKQVLIVDTNRIERLFDTHQITTWEPIGSCGKHKLVALKTPAVLFFFLSLLLRELRKMSAFSQKLVMTTPSSYLEEVEFSRLFDIDNAWHP